MAFPIIQERLQESLAGCLGSGDAEAVKEQEVDISRVTRWALQAFLNGPPDGPSPMVQTLQADETNSQGDHTLEECAMVLLVACEPIIRQRLLTAATHLGRPLHEVTTARLLVTSTP